MNRVRMDYGVRVGDLTWSWPQALVPTSSEAYMRHELRWVRVLDSLKDAMTVCGNSGGERGDQMWVGREALKTLATKGPRSEEDL